jgi:hypothetical protein
LLGSSIASGTSFRLFFALPSLIFAPSSFLLVSLGRFFSSPCFLCLSTRFLFASPGLFCYLPRSFFFLTNTPVMFFLLMVLKMKEGHSEPVATSSGS